MITKKKLHKEELLVISYQTTRCKEAFGELYRMYFEPLYKFVSSITQNREDAFDITQETFVHASTKLYSLKQPITFRFWLFKIAKNKCMDMYKINKKILIQQFSHDTIAQNYDISESIEKNTILDLLNEVLMSLSIEDQLLLKMKYYYGDSIREIMETTGLGISAVKMKILRAKKKIKIEMTKRRA